MVVAPVPDAAAIDAAYPCDMANPQGAFTLCGPGVDSAKGPYAMIQGGFDAAVPLDGDRMRVYGAAFDGDGRRATGLEPGTDFPNDTYQGTDRGTKPRTTPAQMTWTLAVTDRSLKDASRGNATANSGARAIIDGPSIDLAHPHVRVPRPDAVLAADLGDHGRHVRAGDDRRRRLERRPRLHVGTPAPG